MGIITTSIPDGANGFEAQLVKATYDFAKQGGAIGTLALMGSLEIPQGATVMGGFIDVVTPLTSGGAATVALQAEAANDILTAVAVASWTAGRKTVLPAETSGALTTGTVIRTTAARDISMVIAAAALTAGKFFVVLRYIMPLA